MEREARRDAKSYGSATVEKALRLLSEVGAFPEGIALRPLADACDVDRSTAHRLLMTLESRDLVTKLPDRRFVIGSGLVGLAFSGSPDPRLLIGPVLTDLVDQTGESASFSVRYGDTFFCVANQASDHELRYSPVAGTRYPLHAGAAGMALWAFLSEPERDRLLDRGPFDAFTNRTQTDPARLRHLLEVIRKVGYATSQGVRIPGACSVAIPVLTAKDLAVGALAVSSVEARVPLDGLVEFVPILKGLADRLASELNGRVVLDTARR